MVSVGKLARVHRFPNRTGLCWLQEGIKTKSSDDETTRLQGVCQEQQAAQYKAKVSAFRAKARFGSLCYMWTQCSSDANVWLTSSNQPFHQRTSFRRIYVAKADVELQDVSRRGVSRLPGSYGTAASNTEGCWEIIAVGLQG